MDFCVELRRENDKYWQASLRHPFVLGIVNGTLQLEKFRMYMLQDAYYLKQYMKVLGVAAAKADTSEEMRYFIDAAKYVADAELALHETVFGELAITPEQVKELEPAPAAYNYCTHMLQVAYQGDAGEVFAALFPCPWLYQEIGEAFADAKPGVPLYQQWIDLYSSQQLKDKIEGQKAMMNAYAEQQPQKLERYRAHFKRSCYYEWQFWEMAWTLDHWERGVVTHELAAH